MKFINKADQKQEYFPNSIKNDSEVSNSGSSTGSSQVIKNLTLIDEKRESLPDGTNNLSEVNSKESINNSQVTKNIEEESNITIEGSKITGAVIRINNKENKIWAILTISGVLVGVLIYYKIRRKR